MVLRQRLSFAKGAKTGQADEPQASVLVGSKVCCIGKTVIARTIEHLFTEGDRHLQAATVSFDRTGLTPAAFSYSLDRLHRSDGSSVDSDPDGAEDDTWTRFGNCLAQGGHLFDLEGHLLHDALRWAEHVRPRTLLSEVPPLSIVIPVGTSRESTESVDHILDRLSSVEPHFMKLKPIVAFNCCHRQGFYDLERVQKLRDQVKQRGVLSFEIPYGDLSLASTHSFADLATSNAREFAARLDISPMAAHTKLQLFRNWLETVAKNVRAIGLVPNAAEITQAA